MIAVRMLLKSCATPPASWPTTCIFVAWATCRLSLASSLLSLSRSSTAASPRPRSPAMVSATGSPRLMREPDREVARHRRSAGVPANRVGDRGLVFLDDEVARIDRHRAALQRRSLAEGAVHRDESAVPIDQAPGRSGSTSSSAWRLVDSADDPRRSDRTAGTCLQLPSPTGSAGMCTACTADPASPSATSRMRSSSPTSTSSANCALPKGLAGGERPFGERAGSRRGSCPFDPRRRPERPRREPLADTALDPPHCIGQRIRGRSGSGTATAAGRHAAPTRSTSTGKAPACVAIPATQPAPSRHAIDCASFSPWRGFLVVGGELHGSRDRQTVHDRRH